MSVATSYSISSGRRAHEAACKAPNQVDDAVGRPEQKRAGIGGDRPAVETRLHPTALNGCKSNKSALQDCTVQNDEWAVQRARYITLETIPPMSDDPLVSSRRSLTCPARPGIVVALLSYTT